MLPLYSPVNMSIIQRQVQAESVIRFITVTFHWRDKFMLFNTELSLARVMCQALLSGHSQHASLTVSPFTSNTTPVGKELASTYTPIAWLLTHQFLFVGSSWQTLATFLWIKHFKGVLQASSFHPFVSVLTHQFRNAVITLCQSQTRKWFTSFPHSIKNTLMSDSGWNFWDFASSLPPKHAVPPHPTWKPNTFSPACSLLWFLQVSPKSAKCFLTCTTEAIFFININAIESFL